MCVGDELEDLEPGNKEHYNTPTYVHKCHCRHFCSPSPLQNCNKTAPCLQCEKRPSHGTMLSSSELSGSISFSFAFSVLSLNIRTSSCRRSFITALVWLAEEAGRSLSLQGKNKNKADCCQCLSMHTFVDVCV